MDTLSRSALRLRGGSYPQYILNLAALLNNDDNETIETKFFPLYNMILMYWFPPTEGYVVCPRWKPAPDSFVISFVVEHHRHPLLLVEIKPSSDFQSDSARHLAISQVISHLDEIGPTNLHADRLYAISAIGKRWRACYANSGSGTVIDSLQSSSPDYWNPDITSSASWAALQSIADTIKGYVTQ